MIAGIYLDLIEKNQPLSSQQMYDLQNYFKNKNLGTYLRHIYEKVQKNSQTELSKIYYLPFEKTRKNLLGDILQLHQGKLIIVDLWATWCGPCLAALDEIKDVKEKFKNNEDVVFINITNETSNQVFWNKMAGQIDAEHYYLYNNQVDEMFNEHQIESLPSYLLYDKTGDLSEKHLAGYMGNDALLKWIESNLRVAQ